MKTDFLSKKGIGPVIATALLIVVVVITLVLFNSWFSNYSSNLMADVEIQTKSNYEIDIQTLIGNTLYVVSGSENNITLDRLQIEGVDCVIENNLTKGMNEIDISNCLDSISDLNPDIVIITNKNIVKKKVYVRNIPLIINFVPSDIWDTSMNPIYYNYSNDNLTVERINSESVHRRLTSTNYVDSGKKYAVVKIDNLVGGSNVIKVGAGDFTSLSWTAREIGDAQSGVDGSYSAQGAILEASSFTLSGLTTWTTGDEIGVGINFVDNRLDFYKNGVFIASTSSINLSGKNMYVQASMHNTNIGSIFTIQTSEPFVYGLPPTYTAFTN